MALTGMWLTGVEGSLPSAGVTARLYFATDTSRIFLDIGAAWVRLNLIPRGTYAGGTTYYEKDLVTYNGSVWRALATVTGVTPVEGANWTLFVSKGDTGTTSGAAGGDLSGTYPNPQIATGVILDADVNASAGIAESKLALASDAAAETASRRTLGTGATQAAPGNDSRFNRYKVYEWTFAGALTVAVTGGIRVRIPTTLGTVTVVEVGATLGTVSSSGAVTVDVNKALQASLGTLTTLYTTQGNRPSLAANARDVVATLPDVTTAAGGDHLTVDIDAFGTGALNLYVYVVVRF